jgi:hypothetical protein
MELEGIDPAGYAAVLNYVLRADKDASAASEMVCDLNVGVSYKSCRKNLLANLQSFCRSSSLDLEDLNARMPCSIEVMLIGGGAMDRDRVDTSCGKYTGRTSQQQRVFKYCVSFALHLRYLAASLTHPDRSSSVLIGLQKYHEMYVLRRKIEHAPVTVLLQQDFERDSKGYLVVMRKGDPLYNPKLPIAQIRPGELIPFYLKWDEGATCIPIYGTTEDVQVTLKHSYHVVCQKPEKMFKVAELSLPRSEHRAGAHKLVKVVINSAARTVQADVILLDIKDKPEYINFSELTIESVLAGKHTFKIHMHVKSTALLSLHGICGRKGAQWESESIQWARRGVVSELGEDGNPAEPVLKDTKDVVGKAEEALDIGDVDAEGEPEEWTSGPGVKQVGDC